MGVTARMPRLAVSLLHGRLRVAREEGCAAGAPDAIKRWVVLSDSQNGSTDCALRHPVDDRLAVDDQVVRALVVVPQTQRVLETQHVPVVGVEERPI